MVHYVIGGLAILAWLRAPSQKKRLSPEHMVIFETAMTDLHHSGKLRELADSFEKYGAKAEAAILRKRAAVRDLPKSVKDQRTKVYRQALAHNDPTVVEAIAVMFEREACSGAAKSLYDRARGLRTQARIPKAPPPSAPVPMPEPPPETEAPTEHTTVAHAENPSANPPPEPVEVLPKE
jgi:hypothetical protein